MAIAEKTDSVAVVLPANIVRGVFRIRGTAPFVQHRFWKKQDLMDSMATAKVDKKTKANKPPRDYAQEFIDAQHVSTAGWNGIPCAAFRSAMIDACRTVGLVMTKAKMSVFVLPDGFDIHDGTPLSRIISANPPELFTAAVRNDNGGADVRVRPMWREWDVDVTCEWDADMISASSVVNLLDRAGRQVGVGEGRPYSKTSVGQGWGTFTIVTEQ